MSPIVVLAGVGVIAVAAAVALVVLIIGIHRGDPRRPSTASRTSPDAFARRVLLGARYSEHVSADEEKGERE